MKKKLKWFTLVEILIVIVIIGILIWALVPRMSAAQGRARDVARKNDLSNLQAAIVVAYQDLWRYPCTNAKWCKDWDETNWDDGTLASNWICISQLKSKLEAAWMNTVPTDPLATNKVYWLGDSTDVTAGDYRYITVKSHWIEDWWFVVMAKTEVAGSANRVTCTTTDTNGTVKFTDSNNGKITKDDDVKNLRLCDSITQWNECSNKVTLGANNIQTKRECTYKDERDLRYIVMY